MATKIIAIKTNNAVYISDNVEGKSYFSSLLYNKKFDGEFPEKTYKAEWYKINNIPTKVEIREQDKQENVRWELKAGYPISDMMPASLNINPEYSDEYEAVAGLYERKYDVIEGKWVEDELEMDVIADEPDFIMEPNKFPYTPNLIAQITTNPILLPNKPCSLGGQHLYDIVRAAIKSRIDNRWARITSDYDFCFTVKKSLQMNIPKPYTVDIGTKRRPKLETRYITQKEVEVFEMAPKSYQNYTVIPIIRGDNYKDLEKKINDYIDNIVEEINHPLKECSCCKGTGVEEVK